MSGTENPGQTALPGLEAPSDSGGFGAGPLEKSARTSIGAMKAARLFEAHENVLADIAIALAQNIDAGNRKGRAIANEALQLSTLLTQLAGEQLEDIPDTSIPPATKALLDALGTAPRLDTPSASYAA
jgi:hypothetical protein